jgi:hypothetical protein
LAIFSSKNNSDHNLKNKFLPIFFCKQSETKIPFTFLSMQFFNRMSCYLWTNLSLISPHFFQNDGPTTFVVNEENSNELTCFLLSLFEFRKWIKNDNGSKPFGSWPLYE